MRLHSDQAAVSGSRRRPRRARQDGLAASVRLAGLIAIVPALSIPAFAHGGSYRGPAGEVPPDSRVPSDPPPPGDGNGPGTPPGNDPTGPTTGGDPGVGPVTGGPGGGGPTDNGGNSGGPPPTGSGPGGGVSTGGGKRGGGGVGFEDWQFWWNHNQSEILSLRSALAGKRGPSTGTGAHKLSKVGGSGEQSHPATDAAIVSEVVPLLREVLADARENFDVRSAAAIALAKIGDPASIDPIRDLSRNADGKAHKVVVESAALALGLYEKDDAAVRDSLLEAVADPRPSGSFTRPFSAISLGFQPAQGDAAVAVQTVLLGIVSGRESGEDVKPACLLALGLRGDETAIPALLRIVRTERGPGAGAEPLSDIEISHAVQALGRIGRAGTVAAGESAVLDLFLGIVTKDAANSPHVERSAVIALGRVAPAATPHGLGKSVAALIDVALDSADAQSRHFALIALGRIGADPRTTDAARHDCIAALGRVLDKGRPANVVQPYAALGLGLVGRSFVSTGRPVDEETIRKPIREKLAEAKQASARSAFALAAGLAGDPRAADLLLPLLEDKKENKTLRGYSALALGMIGDVRAVEPVRAALVESPERDLCLQSAIGAGLLGDPRAVDDLVAVLREADRGQYVLGSVAVALGAIGDERAIPPLCAIVRDAKAYPDLTRALAVVALGRIGDKRAVPTLARLSTDFNYRAYVPATSELMTIL